MLKTLYDWNVTIMPNNANVQLFGSLWGYYGTNNALAVITASCFASQENKETNGIAHLQYEWKC
jgi:hypothetical protein